MNDKYKFGILNDIDDGKKILRVSIIDSYTKSAVDIYMPYTDPDVIFETNHLVFPRGIISKTIAPKNSAVSLSKKNKQQQYEVKYSLMDEEKHYTLNNLISIVVLERKEVLGELRKQLKDLFDKSNLTKD